MSYRSLIGFLLVLSFASGPAQAAEDHQSEPEHAHGSEDHGEEGEAVGSHGGVVFERDDVEVELKLIESEEGARYHAWVQDSGEPAGPSANLALELTRIDGSKEVISFIPGEQQGWVSASTVDEPHSFDLGMSLSVDGESYRWEWASYEGRTEISSDIADSSSLKSEPASNKVLLRTTRTYGRLTTTPEQIARVTPRFPGLVTSISARLGQTVAKGETLAQVESNESLNTYKVTSPISGKVIQQTANIGEATGSEPLFSIANFDSLMAELKVFPGQQPKVAPNSKVFLLVAGSEYEGEIDYILPASDSPFTLAYVKLANTEGQLSPGQLVVAEIVTDKISAELVVKNTGIQTVDGATVVFVNVGDAYELRPVELGRSDATYTEVLSGLKPGERYVSDNSYLIKADLEKAGAAHEH